MASFGMPSNKHESRREWMLDLMLQTGEENKRNNDFQFWQQHNHPVELGTSDMLQQRLDYIHNNPVALGLVEKEEEWLHSSAGDYHGIRKEYRINIYLGRSETLRPVRDATTRERDTTFQTS
jgi:hypothetical protein